jgi:hypothetical protein
LSEARGAIGFELYPDRRAGKIGFELSGDGPIISTLADQPNGFVLYLPLRLCGLA